MGVTYYSEPQARQPSTLRLRDSSCAPAGAGRVRGCTVLRWVDEAGVACASAWAKGPCVMELMGSAQFGKSIRPEELVEVRARLAYTDEASMCIAIEVHSGDRHGTPLRPVVHCVAVYTAADADDAARRVDTWHTETPGDMARAQRVKAHVDAARAAQ